VAAIPHIFRVYTRDQILAGAVLQDDVSQRVMNGYNERRGADIIAIPDPYWIFNGPRGTTHGSPFGYDTHVPVIFMGAGIRPGRYSESIAVNDIAPTLATMLDVETPSGAVGRVLDEMFEPRTPAAAPQAAAGSLSPAVGVRQLH
jgi:arylsulfatase A-like enzyme